MNEICSFCIRILNHQITAIISVEIIESYWIDVKDDLLYLMTFRTKNNVKSKIAKITSVKVTILFKYSIWIS